MAPVAGQTWCAAPCNPYSFVTEHHVFRGQGASNGPDVVRRSLQTLIPSSPSTTSSGAMAPVAGRTWCAAPCNPYSFVTEHLVFRGQGASNGPDVVRRSLQTLIPSSPSTTSSGAMAPVLA